MATFKPPTDDFVVPVIISSIYNQGQLSKEERMANRLGGRITPSPRGRNIYLLTDGSYTDNQPSTFDNVSKTYYGGHDITITDAEAASLTAAGYGAYIS
jgi:hypothetical protein